jgi:endogenous inhibitor of DNA gyrase (YacG/DUF329 family)
MKKPRSCAICEKMTTRFLFEDEMLAIPICSKKCEHEYLENLTYEDKEQISVVRYLDGKIAGTKTRNKMGWGLSGFGAVLIIIGFVIADALIFIGGNVIVAFGTLSTRYFEDKIDKLTRLRKRIVV